MERSTLRAPEYQRNWTQNEDPSGIAHRDIGRGNKDAFPIVEPRARSVSTI